MAKYFINVVVDEKCNIILLVICKRLFFYFFESIVEGSESRLKPSLQMYLTHITHQICLVKADGKGINMFLMGADGRHCPPT